ncbi:MAG: biotin/lipoate A/B protein ligase family protein [Candidatus Erginobacter occultus]|nr:biotin/lipoate A/B protein ligase family protein [Candidatus Erginobacter occultus]
MHKLNLLLDRDHPGAMNMAIDQVLGEAAAARPGEIFLRFYGWEPPTVTLGYNQPLADLNLEALDRDGIGWVRRMTGGGGVLHWNEITYAIAAPFSPAGGTSRGDLFRFCADLLSLLYRSLGIETAARAPGPYTPFADCFAAPGAYELVEVTTGKKIAGSASALKRGYFLQHGSLPLDDTRLRIDRYLAVSSPAPQPGGSIAIGDFVTLGREEVLERFRAGLEDNFPVVPFRLSGEIFGAASRLAEEKYSSPAWAHRRHSAIGA